jgi:hypothetical protein
MANKILSQLLLNIEANTAGLKQGLDKGNGMLSDFGSHVKKIGGFLVSAFAVGSILEAGKAVFQFSQHIGEATNQLKNLGVTGNELTQATAKALATAETLNVPFEKLLESARNVSKAFGITMVDALEKVKQGYIQTGSDEFLDSLREYPRLFGEMGGSVDEFMKINIQSVNEGVYSDKGIDAVKEFGLRIRELTPATKDALTAIGLSGTEIQKQIEQGTLTTYGALQKVSARLANFADDSRQVGQVLADVFGGAGEDAGIRFIKSLSDSSVTFDTLKANLTDAQAASLRLVNANEELNKTWVQMFGSSSTLFNNLKASMLELTVTAIKGIRKGLIDIANGFISIYNESTLFRGIVQSTKFAFQEMWELIKLNFRSMTDFFSGLGSLIKAVFTANFDEIPAILKKMWEDQKTDFTEFGKTAAENFKNAFEATVKRDPIKFIDEAAVKADAGKAASVAVGAARAATTTAPDNTKDIKAAHDMLGLDTVSNKLDDTTAKTKKATEAAKTLGETFQQQIGNVAVDAFAQLGAVITDTTKTGKEKQREMVISVLQGLASVIKGYLATAISASIAANAGIPGIGLVLAAAAVTAVSAMFNNLPKFGDGGTVKQGQNLQLVGERGQAELTMLPTGSHVFSGSDTRKMVDNGIGGTENIFVKIESFTRGEDIYHAVKEVTRRRGN